MEATSQMYQEISFTASDHLGGFQSLKDVIIDELASKS
jgi:hypothetical protein